MQVETIEIAREMMSNWARWARTNRLEMTWPSSSPFARLIRNRGDSLPAPAAPIDDDLAELVDAALAALSLSDSEMQQLLKAHYLIGFSVRAIAMLTGEKKDRVHRLIHSAEVWVSGFVSARIATRAA